MRTAFITGCGSGFGHLLAATWLAAGWRVVATDPDVASLADLGPDDRVLRLALDVRDDAAVKRAAAREPSAPSMDALMPRNCRSPITRGPLCNSAMASSGVK